MTLVEVHGLSLPSPLASFGLLRPEALTGLLRLG